MHIKNRCVRKIAQMWGFSWLVLSALSSCQNMAISLPQPNIHPIAAAPAKPTQERKMIETLQKLCNVLSQSPLTAPQAATSIGKIIEDPGKDSALLVQPSHPGFKAALVVRQAGTNEPAHVELTLAEPSTLSLKTLTAAFGKSSKLPNLHVNSSKRLIFEVDLPNTSHTCAVIANVMPGKNGSEDSMVTAVTIRRDIRLE
jgi:hypothetical protein